MPANSKHRSGPLKQKNKAHKNGKHKTKGEVNNVHKGENIINIELIALSVFIMYC